jgi:hypothetical protein
MRSTIIQDTVHQVIYEQYIGMIVLGYGGALECDRGSGGEFVWVY